MSKQDGLLQFTGKMGGISFYKQKGVHMARKATGPSRSQILNNPQFENMRLAMAEFKGVNMATALFLKTFSATKKFRDAEGRIRVVKLMNSTQKLSEDEMKGQRGVYLSRNRNMFRDLELIQDNNLDTVFTTPFQTTVQDRIRARITFEEIRPLETVTPPPKATHYQMVQVLGAVPDVVFNPILNAYEKMHRDIAGLNRISYSDYLPAKTPGGFALTMETELPEPLPDDVSMVHAIGILFFEKIGNMYNPIRQHRALRVIEVI